MINVLISTLYQRLDNVEKIIGDFRNDVSYIIVVQAASKDEFSTYIRSREWTSRCDVILLYNSEIGVTKSRNLALNHISGDLVLFGDDDVSLSNECFEIILESFSSNPEVSFLTFNVEDEYGHLLKRPLSDGYHTLRTILGVGTIQIAFRVTEKTRHIRFPTDLGAGATYPCCDEPVYLANFIKSGLSGMHINRTICMHPRLSSGMIIDSKWKLLSRWIAFRYIFGSLVGGAVFGAFCIKNLRRIRL